MRKNKSSLQSEKIRSFSFIRNSFYVVVIAFLIFAFNNSRSNGDTAVAEKKPVNNTGNARIVGASAKPSIDQVAATDLAANLASTANLSVANNVVNQAISVNAKSEFSSDSDDVISKPNAIQDAVVNYEIINYTAKVGDTTDSVAAQFNLRKESVKWSNNLQSDALEPGRQLLIPPVDGLVAVAQSGDTSETLAQKYNTNADRVALFNDEGFTAGKQVVIPGGTVAAPAPQNAPSRSTANNVFTNAAVLSAGGNRYDYGYCTWYAYNRRMELGMPIGGMWGNASSWASLARVAGFRVDNVPSVGAVMQTANAAGGYGHVAVVESVGRDGSITVSEMNVQGWNVKSTGTFTAGQAASYNYIH